MILGRSDGKYQSFFCFNATNGIRGCTNRGYKSARIIDEAVLRTVMATLFTDALLGELGGELFSEQNAVQFVQERQARNELRRAGRSRIDQLPWYSAPDEAGYSGVRIKNQPHVAAPHDTP